jgi:hypothetical protein
MSIPGMATATLICLVATAMAMTDTERYAKLALFLFAIAWLVFYISIAMPIRIKRRSTSND